MHALQPGRPHAASGTWVHARSCRQVGLLARIMELLSACMDGRSVHSLLQHGVYRQDTVGLKSDMARGQLICTYAYLEAGLRGALSDGHGFVCCASADVTVTSCHARCGLELQTCTLVNSMGIQGLHAHTYEEREWYAGHACALNAAHMCVPACIGRTC